MSDIEMPSAKLYQELVVFAKSRVSKSADTKPESDEVLVQKAIEETDLGRNLAGQIIKMEQFEAGSRQVGIKKVSQIQAEEELDRLVGIKINEQISKGAISPTANKQVAWAQALTQVSKEHPALVRAYLSD